MKKLFVFLSIFAVLFVSTIRPLHAEFIDDEFTLVNGNTYYLVFTKGEVSSGISITLAVSQSYPQSTINFECVTFDDCFLDVVYQSTAGATEQYLEVSLDYLGTIDNYFGYNNVEFGESYVYSFVWSVPTVPYYVYDDYYFAFDTENPIPPISIYDTIYALVNKYVFGNNIESGSHQDLTATILSTTICVLVFALPFLIIWKVIKIIMG